MDTGRILIMRHAEKPDAPLDSGLTDAGRERAQRLAKYIPETFGKPDLLFASADSKYSRRPRKTLTPLSKACGIAIDDSFADQDYPALAHEIRNKPLYDGKRIVICWHHGNIPLLAHSLKARPGDYPDPWDPVIFNLILELDIARGAPAVRPVLEPF
jgi:broad specificity phosphatase PhoE